MKLISKSTLHVIFKKQLQAQCRSLGHYSQSNRKKQGNDNHYYYYKHTEKASLIGATTAGILGYYFFMRNTNDKRHAFAAEKCDQKHYCRKDDGKPGEWREDLPTYCNEEISTHTTPETGIWVTYKAGVYDITDYVKLHPGGDQILLAAGGNLESTWRTYGFHEFDFILEELEKLRIGNLGKRDQVNMGDFEDPYEKDPLRHKNTEAVSTRPYCGSVKLSMLADSFITPAEYFYVRNHLPVPQLDPSTYEFVLQVEGERKCMKFTLDELKKMPKHTITCALSCSGNRRSEMMKVTGQKKAAHWGPNAMGNATWTGVKLRDLLKKVGITEEETKYKHVQFEGYDYELNGKPYGGSIPIGKAVDERGDVILAYEMNGAPLTPDHGFPVRIITPGTTGARHVKWLARILVSEHESPCHYQQVDYKAFPPNARLETADYENTPAINTLPVTSAICRPSEGQVIAVKDGFINIKGYAYSGGGNKIMRVDVTLDHGKNWHVANLDHQDDALPPRHWAWTLWSIKLPIPDGNSEVEIWCKAVDSNFNTQPETFENIFNFQGSLCNAYHRVQIKLCK